MRTPTLLLDGQGRVRLACTRAPDLLRRAVAAQTGAAHLLAVALPPPGMSSRTLVEGLAARLGGERLADGTWLLAADAARAKRALARAAAGEAEPLATLRRLLKRLAKRIRRWRLGDRSATPPASSPTPSPAPTAPRA